MKFKIFVISVIFTLFLCVSVYFLLLRGMPLFLFVLPVIPVSVYLLNNQKVLYGAIICTPFSNITIPGLPGSLKLFHLLVLFATLVSVLNICLNKSNTRKLSVSQKAALIFVANLLIVMLVRGAGLRVFGGDQWGGMRYVEAIIPFFLVFLSPSFVYTTKDWKKLMVLFMCFSSLPMLSEMVFLLSGGRIYHLYYVIKFNMSTLHTYTAELTGADVVRFQTVNKLAPFVVCASLVLYRMKVRLIVFAGIYFFGVFLVGISGHRSVFIDLVLLSWVVMLLFHWQNRWTYILTSAVGISAVLLLLYLLSDQLPSNFQRAISFLPGISISEGARLDAMITIDWRLNLWQEALNELARNPDFWIVGKGLTYSASEYTALQLFDFSYWWAILTSNYHQGILSLIIITGLPGFLSATAFFFFTGKEAVGQLSRFPPVSFLHTLYLVLTVYFIILCVKYFLVYGDMTLSFIPLCFIYFLLKQISATAQSEITHI